MKRYGHLFEKIITFENLKLAYKKAACGKKDKNSVMSFSFNLENELLLLKQDIQNKTYHPKPYSTFEVKEPKVRKICSSEFRDRVAHHAICSVIEPYFEKRSIFDSYACRVDKGSHLAIQKCQQFSKKYPYYLKCDIKKYFENIDHEILKKLLLKVFKDPDLIDLLNLIIDHKVPESISGKGLPIGNLTSQHFANLYLGELDHFIKDRLGVCGYLRYMDDFICFGGSKKEMWDLHSEIDFFIMNTLKLEIKKSVTQIAPICEGIPFLGFRIFPELIRIKSENLKRLRNKIYQKEAQFKGGRITQKDLINSVQSMIAHIQHANSQSVRKDIFNNSIITV